MAEVVKTRRKKRNPLREPRRGKGSLPRKGLMRSVADGGLETKLKPKDRSKQKLSAGLGGTQRMAADSLGGKCNAQKKNGDGKCQLPAGYGTDHPQIGRCRYHSGNTPSGNKHAIVERARLMGAPIDMNPVEAIIWSIRITAGEVKWLSEQIAALDKKDWHEDTIIGRQMHLYVRERRDRVGLLYKMGNDAIKLGLAERAIKMAEMYGVALSRFIMGVLEDLQLTEEQAVRAPTIVRKHLIALEGNKPMGDELARMTIEGKAEEVKELVA
jgi:hypothetical protein